MINGKKIIVVMPAYRAAKTLEITWRALPHAVVDHEVEAPGHVAARVILAPHLCLGMHEA